MPLSDTVHTPQAADIKLIPVAELLDGKHRFFVPDYQRGYRWTPQQVKELLEDLLTFAITEGRTKGSYYCLQPVVVRKNDERWEVIDGQQRLTTIRILLRYLKEHYKDQWSVLEISMFSLEYASREKTTEFIDSPKLGNPEHDAEEPIDFFYMKEAYLTIVKWFTDLEEGAPRLCEKLGEGRDEGWGLIKNLLVRKDENNCATARILWYEAAENENGIELFKRLNTGKLELTDSELVKGLFILKTKARGDNERTALTWEEMENEFHDDAFWSFLTPRPKKESDQDKYANRIDLLLDLVVREHWRKAFEDALPMEWTTNTKDEETAKNERKKKLEKWIDEKMNRKRAIFNFFNDRFNEKEDSRDNQIQEEWEGIDNTFRTLKDWFFDPMIYNLVGYLCQTRTATLQKVFNDFQSLKNEHKTREDFIGKLKSRIKTRWHNKVSLQSEPDKRGSGRNWTINLSYKERDDVFDLLVLLNIEHLNKRASIEHCNERTKKRNGDDALKPGERELCKFPFAVLAEKWDIEHVDSQTANQLDKPLDRWTWIQTSLNDLDFRLNEKKKWPSIKAQLGFQPDCSVDDVKSFIDDVVKCLDKDKTSFDKKSDVERRCEELDKNGKTQSLIRFLQDLAGEGDGDWESDEDSENDGDLEKHNINNLVLLDCGTNRSYKNGLFVSKRKKIIKRREGGQYVPETTSYVFFKLIERSAITRWEWTKADRQCYANYIVEQLSDYLIPKA